MEEIFRKPMPKHSFEGFKTLRIPIPKHSFGSEKTFKRIKSPVKHTKMTNKLERTSIKHQEINKKQQNNKNKHSLKELLRKPGPKTQLGGWGWQVKPTRKPTNNSLENSSGNSYTNTN